jgi:tetratricopeptide (TPR) repeat protein
MRGLRVLGRDPSTGGQPPHTQAQTYVIARLTATLAKSVVETDGLEPALALMDEAAAVAQPISDHALEAFLAGQRGLILFRGGRLTEARAFLDEACARTPDASGLDKWRILVNRGALLVESGQVRLARADLHASVSIARSSGLPQAERIALHNLGCLEFTAGDLPRALRLMHEGMELDGETQQGIAHLDRSRVLLAAGLAEEADTALAVAADLFRRDRCWQDLGEVDLTRAEVALLTGRLDDARKLAGRARDRFRRHGNDRWRRAAELALLHADLAL